MFGRDTPETTVAVKNYLMGIWSGCAGSGAGGHRGLAGRFSARRN